MPNVRAISLRETAETTIDDDNIEVQFIFVSHIVKDRIAFYNEWLNIDADPGPLLNNEITRQDWIDQDMWGTERTNDNPQSIKIKVVHYYTAGGDYGRLIAGDDPISIRELREWLAEFSSGQWFIHEGNVRVQCPEDAIILKMFLEPHTRVHPKLF